MENLFVNSISEAGSTEVENAIEHIGELVSQEGEWHRVIRDITDGISFGYAGVRRFENCIAILPDAIDLVSGNDANDEEAELQNLFDNIFKAVPNVGCLYLVMCTRRQSDRHSPLHYAASQILDKYPEQPAFILLFNKNMLPASENRNVQILQAFADLYLATRGMFSMADRMLAISSLMPLSRVFARRSNVPEHFSIESGRGLFPTVGGNEFPAEEHDYELEIPRLEEAQAKEIYAALSRGPEFFHVFFGTNRAPVNADNLADGFTGERDHRLYYGACSVEVKRSHAIRELLRRVSFGGFILGARKPKLVEINPLPENTFFEVIKQVMAKHGDVNDKMVTVFIHGYNMSFDESVTQAAQIAADLRLPGAFAVYSWPSMGELTGYMADGDAVNASKIYMAEFINKIVDQSGARRINIIAHSMGNRGLLQSFEKVIKDVFAQSGKMIAHIVLAAPDIDKDSFDESHKALSECAERTTMYVSDRDRALQLSGFLHNYPRAGLAPPVTVQTGIDTVHVGSVDLSFLGHGYISSNRLVLADLYYLLREGIPPHRRKNIEAVDNNGNPYWQFASL